MRLHGISKAVNTFNSGVISGHNFFIDINTLRTGDHIFEIDTAGKCFNLIKYSLLVVHNPSYFNILTNENTSIIKYENDIAVINATFTMVVELIFKVVVKFITGAKKNNKENEEIST